MLYSIIAVQAGDIIFADFSKNLFRLCAAQDYQPAASIAKQTPEEAVCWGMGKVETASAFFVRVADCDRFDASRLQAEYEVMLTRTAELLNTCKNVIVLYLLVSENEHIQSGEANETSLRDLLERAENYDGQPVYRVLWRVYLDTCGVESMPGQPRELFGLRALIEKALTSSHSASEENQTDIPLTFDDIASAAQAAPPYQPKRKFPACTASLAVINAVIVLLMYLDGFADNVMVASYFGAIVPDRVWAGEYYRLFTAMFVHFGVLHFLMNMLGLFIFGTRVERYYGRLRFIVIYILSGLCGSVFSLFFTRGYAAGASGAIYGLVGAAFAFTRILKISMDGLSAYLMLLYILMGLAFGVLSPGIDNFGHIGGLLMGLLLGVLLTVTRKNKRV